MFYQRRAFLISWSVLFCVSLCTNIASGKECYSMDIRNNATNLNQLRNCTEIVGYLRILLMDKVNSEDVFDDYVFPELTKISHYLLFYKVNHLPSVAKLFPNLRVIRGVQLYTDYALAIYNMPHLREIGTSKLLFIARGMVKVDKSPRLCFVDTIDWRRIGADMLHFTNTNNGTCPSCPEACKGYCWNTEHCQVLDTDKCHQECLGCTQDYSAKHCDACKNFEDNGTCVAMCPPEKFLQRSSYKCLTKQECLNFQNRTWWTFKNECVDTCPPDYEPADDINRGLKSCRFCNNTCVQYCQTKGDIEDTNALERMKGCTHINESLSLRIEKKGDKELELYLGKIRYINGTLTIRRTNSITSLAFLKNLRLINGSENVAMFIYENQNLEKLWNFTDKEHFNLTIRGAIRFHDNPQLCVSEIEKLANLTNATFSPIDVSPYSNGDMSACNSEVMNVRVTNRTSTNVTIEWDESHKNRSYVGYAVYYTEYTGENMTTFENQCNAISVYSRGRRFLGWESVGTGNSSVFLSKLTPYTKYAYYIKSYQTGTRSTIMTFTTLSDDPESPSYFIATAADAQSINLTWGPPLNKNGILDRYEVSVYLVLDCDDLLEKRNYCEHPRSPGGDKTDDDEYIFPHVEEDFRYQTESPTDSCNKHPTRSTREEYNFHFVDNLMLRLCDKNSQSNYGFDYCKNYYYSVFNETKSPILRQKRSPELNQLGNYSNLMLLPVVKINPKKTWHVIDSLRHFTMYVFFIKACNKITESEKELCSSVQYSFARTKKNLTADNIENVNVSVTKDSSVEITWDEPAHPNAFVVSYIIEPKNLDAKHSQQTFTCIPNQRKASRRKRHTLPTLFPGDYVAKVKAVSLAGPGSETLSEKFSIEDPRSGTLWIGFFVLSIVVLLVFLAGLSYLWYKKKHELDNIHLIAGINPDYSGVVYIEDEWEMDRNDIKILRELGQGSFGTVFCGIIKSRKMYCAIKTLTESAALQDRMQFLSEASAMKSVSKAHHVVKLLGVVSRGLPALVVMELMERGDLKGYLRRMRDSSQNITSAEIYRMAIEMADGMAYLAAKKFVHRDLAARNCMVGQDRTVKIGDFGMARDVYETDYYKKGKGGLLPVRWMAPESLADGVFTSDSDVWSYGVVLWEIATLAEQPYQGLANEQVVQFVVSRGRLTRPQECPDLLFEIMHACWLWRPNDRPTFSDIVEKLENHVGQDFKLVSFYHSREGHEIRLIRSERTYNPPALGMGAEEHDQFCHDSDEEASLYTNESNKRGFLPISGQRASRLSNEFN